MKKIKKGFIDIIGIVHIACPSCGQEIQFYPNGSIEVKAETKKDVRIEGFYELNIACQNPFCKWSIVKVEKRKFIDVSDLY